MIKEMKTEDTGGGIVVEMVIFQDNKIVASTDDCVCSYKDMESFEYGEFEEVFYF